MSIQSIIQTDANSAIGQWNINSKSLICNWSQIHTLWHWSQPCQIKQSYRETIVNELSVAVMAHHDNGTCQNVKVDDFKPFSSIQWIYRRINRYLIMQQHILFRRVHVAENVQQFIRFVEFCSNQFQCLFLLT